MGVTAIQLLFVVLVTSTTAASPPNIVFILGDDLGWNDIGFNNPDILSPNLDALANGGVILNQSYVQPLCSPSRSAFMTGVYPFRLGLQHLVIGAEQAVCAPLNRTFLPQVLKKQGYATHMVGKWHLGFCKWECTPTYRGFDSFYGYYQGMEDYYTKDVAAGFDFRDNKDVVRSANGTYSSYQYSDRLSKIVSSHNVSQPLFLYVAFQNVHVPLEVPKKYSDMYPHIKDEKRRTFSGMVTALDDTVGVLVDSLKSKGLYDNTLFVFSGDNGGMVVSGGNNYPLRGGKATVFEGGTRAAAFVHGPMFTKTGSRYNGMIHVTDWFPTLVEAAGSTYKDPDQDGVSQWKSLLSMAVPSQRDEIVYNMDFSVFPVEGRAAIRWNDYKLIDGFPGVFQDWYKPAQVTRVSKSMEKLAQIFGGGAAFDWETVSECVAETPRLAVVDKMLFNLRDDPFERNNIYDKHPDIVKKLEARLEAHKKKYVEPNFPKGDPKGNPDNYGGNWTPGWC